MVVDLDQVMEESKQALAAFQERIAEQEEVMECYLMNGDSDDPIRGI
jgi:DNA-binding Lrp family transcriptional regulator